MKLRRAPALAVSMLCASTPSLAAQDVVRLSLKDAEQRALQDHPQVRADQYAALAVGETVRQVKSFYFPTVYGSLTGADAQSGSRIAAGGLNNPIILDRFAAGFSVSQMLTDFGRTSELVQSSNLRAQAARQDVVSERADVLLRVDRAYFNALRTQAVLRVAEDTVSARQVVVDQVTALAASNLKSALDVSFAKVNLSEAQLLLLQARNDVQAGFAGLSAALGLRESPSFDLSEEPLPSAPPSDSATVVAQALRERADLIAERFVQQSASRFADAERALWFPTISAVGAAGVTPYRQVGLNSQYAALGINVSVPLTNGNLFSARHAEASFRALAVEQRVRELENRVARDVRVALLDAQTGYQRLDLTNQLLDQASQALELAEARYNLGLSSIVELTQAQLNKTRAEIEQAGAKYDYQARISAFRYQMGTLK